MRFFTDLHTLIILGCPLWLCVEATRSPQLPITQRGFLTGTTVTVDRSLDMAAAYNVARSVGPITMLWTQNNGVGLYEALTHRNPVSGRTTYDDLRRMGFLPILNLNPWTVQPGKGIVRNDGTGSVDFSDPEFRRRLCEEARRVAERFRPTYFSIGNEINSVYERLGVARFRELAAVEKHLYRTIKAASPSTRVIVVVSYSQLVDESGTPRFALLSHLRGSYDVLGITSYPWRRYAVPADLPEDYYSRLSKHTDKPIAFTEIGWSSDPDQGGSEEEQAKFLIRFLVLTRSLKLEFVNWAFLHDLPETAVTGFVVQRTHLGLGLRRYEGTPKPVWHLFRALADLPGPIGAS